MNTSYYNERWLREERNERIWWWVRVLAVVAVCLGVIGYCRHYRREGFEVMMADPPRVVVEKTHTIRSASYSCGKNCITNSNTDVYTLFAADGGSCEVDKHEWVTTEKGTKWKCMNLYGWRE